MNCIRKHLSKVKGGGLAKMASPARLINLILSDVIGDRIDTIASGITAPDPTTFADALSIVRKYALVDKLPSERILLSLPATLSQVNPIWPSRLSSSREAKQP